MNSGSYYHYREPVLDWSVFYVVTLVGSTLAVVALALSAACGLFYLAELAEEYSTAARRLLRYGIAVVLVLHALILSIDRLSWWRSVVSLVANAAYYQLLATFPWVKLSSPVCITAVFCFAIDNIGWYSLFMLQSGEFPFWSVVSFFVVLVWLVPVGFFVSLAVSDDRIPIGVASPNSKKERRTFASLMNFLMGRKNDF